MCSLIVLDSSIYVCSIRDALDALEYIALNGMEDGDINRFVAGRVR